MEEQYDEIRNPALGHGMLEVLEDPNEIGSKAWLDSSAAVDGKHSDNFFRMSDIKVLECTLMITHPKKPLLFPLQYTVVAICLKRVEESRYEF